MNSRKLPVSRDLGVFFGGIGVSGGFWAWNRVNPFCDIFSRLQLPTGRTKSRAVFFITSLSYTESGPSHFIVTSEFLFTSSAQRFCVLPERSLDGYVSLAMTQRPRDEEATNDSVMG